MKMGQKVRKWAKSHNNGPENDEDGPKEGDVRSIFL
jgi:hypothetical protein